MKLLLAVLLVSLSCAYCQRNPVGLEPQPRKEEWNQPEKGEWKYTDRYDKMNIDEMLVNKRLINAYMKCLDGSGKCTAEGRYLKSHITDALQTGCKRCTDAQHKGVRKVVKYVVDKEPQVWEKLVKMYDPKGEYAKKYREEMKNLKQG